MAKARERVVELMATATDEEQLSRARILKDCEGSTWAAAFAESRRYLLEVLKPGEGA